jgi:type IV pilus assembly protein PilC
LLGWWLETDVRSFAFEAVDESGTRLRGMEVAANEGDLDRQLAKRGLVLLEARSARRRGRVTPRTVIDVFYHLSVILEAGVPILQGIRDLQESGEHPLAAELADIERRIEGGTSLSDALAAHPHHFPSLAVSLVRAGEGTGRLAGILSDLVTYLEWREDLRRQIRAATTYPSIVLLSTFGLCGILAFFVLPRFSGIFAELGVEIPAPMRAILFVRDMAVGYWPILLSCAVLFGVGFLAWARSEPGRAVRDGIVLRIPLLSRLILGLDLSRFCHNLSVLYSAGLPILEGLSLTADIVQNRVVRGVIRKAADRLRAGAGLMESLQPEGVFPSMVLRMLHTGESTGQLDRALDHVARFYDREVPRVIERVIASFNFGVLIFMGGTIVVIALSFFVPLYEMLGSISAG